MSVHNEKRGAHAKSVTQNINTVYTPDVHDYTKSADSPQLTKSQLSKNNVSRNVSQPVSHHRITKESKRYKYTIAINQRYLADAVQKAFDSGHNHLVILSDMGSGKSWMLITHINNQEKNDVTIVITPLASLCQGNANRYQLAGLDAVNYTELGKEKERNNVKECQVVTTTYNTLPEVERQLLAAGRTINIVAIDESEAGAQFLAGGTISNKSESGESLRKLVGMCKHALLMDAHCDLGTYLLGAVFTDKTYTLLANTYQVWADHTYSWHEGREAGLALIVDLIDAGKKVFITATTAGQAKKIHLALNRLGVLAGLRVLAAYPSNNDDETEELRDAKDNQELFKSYDVVIASPTVGVGISIDGEWFDSVVSFFIRDKDAPSASGAMQMPFRVRNIGDKHIHLVRVDQIERGRKLSEWQIMEDKKAYESILTLMDAHAFDDAEQSELFGKLARLHGGFESRLDVHDSQMFDEYYEIIDREFSDKGIKIVDACPTAEMDSPFKGLNRDIKDKHIAELLAAPIITAKECAEIESRAKFQPRTVKNEEKKAVEKHYLINAYHHSEAETPTEEELINHIKQAEKGTAIGRNNIARGMLPLIDINRLQKHYRTSRDAADKRGAHVKEFWKIDRVLLDVAGVHIGDMGGVNIAFDAEAISNGTLTSKEKGDSVTRKLAELAKTYNTTKPDTRLSVKALHENPCKVVKKLIETRLKLVCKFVHGKKERESLNDWSFTVVADQPVLDNLNMMMEKRGVFGDLRVLAELSANDATEKMTGVDVEVTAHIKMNLSKIPHGEHETVLTEYLRIAALPREMGDNVTPQAHANVWLYDRANSAKRTE
jgi:hypothetical protein